MRALAFTFLMLLPPAAAVADESAFTFPGDDMSSASRSGDLSASYRASDEGPLRFVVTEKEKEPEQEKEVASFDFLRTVDGQWRDNALFVNNHIGSNTSDCLVLTKGEQAYGFTSVRSLLDRDGSIDKASDWIKPAQLAPNAEYHMICETWESDNKIDVAITGNTGIEAFKYHLRVDLSNGRFSFTK